MKLQMIDLVVLLIIMIFSTDTDAKTKSNDVDHIDAHEYTVHHHNYEEQSIPSTIDDLQTDESTVIKIRTPPQSNQKFSIRPKRGSKKFRHFVHVVSQARRKRKLNKPRNEQHRPSRIPKEQTEVKVFRSFEETHDHVFENASSRNPAQEMTQAESKQYEIRAEEELSEPDLEANEQHQHTEKGPIHKEHQKIKVKHHHHHHHHNHVKEIIKKVPEPYPVEKVVYVPVEKVVEKVVHVPKPYPVEKIVEKKVPYPVEKIVHVPVEKVIEKIVHVPKPYPVEKMIEKVVHVPVEKVVERIVHVPKPYPVEKVVNKVVHVPKPYPVIKPVPYPVEVRVPFPVEKPMPYPVERKVPVPYRVEVERKVPMPYKVEVQRKHPIYMNSHEPYKFEKPKDQKQQRQQQQQQQQMDEDIEGPDGFERYESQRENLHHHDLTTFPSNQETRITRNNDNNNINHSQGQIVYGTAPFTLRAENFQPHLHNFNYEKQSSSLDNAPHSPNSNISNNNNDSNNNNKNTLLDMELSPSSVDPQSANPLARLTPMNPIALPLQVFQIQPYPFQRPIVAV